MQHQHSFPAFVHRILKGDPTWTMDRIHSLFSSPPSTEADSLVLSSFEPPIPHHPDHRSSWENSFSPSDNNDNNDKLFTNPNKKRQLPRDQDDKSSPSDDLTSLRQFRPYSISTIQALETVPPSFFSIFNIFQEMAKEYNELKDKEGGPRETFNLPNKQSNVCWIPYTVSLYVIWEKFKKRNNSLRTWESGWEAWVACNSERVQVVSNDRKKKELVLQVGWDGIGLSCRRYFVRLAWLSRQSSLNSTHSDRKVKRLRIDSPNLQAYPSQSSASPPQLSQPQETPKQTSQTIFQDPLEKAQIRVGIGYTFPPQPQHLQQPPQPQHLRQPQQPQQPPTASPPQMSFSGQPGPHQYPHITNPHMVNPQVSNHRFPPPSPHRPTGNARRPPRRPFQYPGYHIKPSPPQPSKSAAARSPSPITAIDPKELDLTRPYPSMDTFDMCGETPKSKVSCVPENWINPLEQALNRPTPITVAPAPAPAPVPMPIRRGSRGMGRVVPKGLSRNPRGGRVGRRPSVQHFQQQQNQRAGAPHHYQSQEQQYATPSRGPHYPPYVPPPPTNQYQHQHQKTHPAPPPNSQTFNYPPYTPPQTVGSYETKITSTTTTVPFAPPQMIPMVSSFDNISSIPPVAIDQGDESIGFQSDGQNLIPTRQLEGFQSSFVVPPVLERNSNSTQVFDQGLEFLQNNQIDFDALAETLAVDNTDIPTNAFLSSLSNPVPPSEWDSWFNVDAMASESGVDEAVTGAGAGGDEIQLNVTEQGQEQNENENENEDGDETNQDLPDTSGMLSDGEDKATPNNEQEESTT